MFYRKLYKSIRGILIRVMLFLFLFMNCHNFTYATSGMPADAVPLSFRLASNLGESVLDYKGRGPKKIYIIENMHSDPNTQIKIEEIITNLKDFYKSELNLIGQEGSVGVIDTSIIGDIKNPGIKHELTDYFLKQGKLVGSELYKIDHPSSEVILYGIEDKELYNQDFAFLYKSLVYNTYIQPIISKLKLVITRGKQLLYTKKLQNLEAMQHSYDQNEISLYDYLKYLNQESRAFDINLTTDYPNLAKLLKSADMEKDLHKIMIQQEADHIVESFSAMLNTEQLQEFKQEMELGDYYTSLKSFLERKRINITRYYPNLNKYFTYLDYKKNIDSIKVLRELKDLTTRLKLNIAKDLTDTEKLIYCDTYLAILNRMIQNKSNIRDVNLWQANKSRFYKLMPDMINKLSYTNEFARNKNHIKLAEKNTANFYTQADKRNEILIKNMLSAMDKYSHLSSMDIGIMITGGFHTEGLTEILRNKAISYEVIRPKIETKYNKKIYINRIKEQADMLYPKLVKTTKKLLTPNLSSKSGTISSRPNLSSSAKLGIQDEGETAGYQGLEAISIFGSRQGLDQIKIELSKLILRQSEKGENILRLKTVINTIAERLFNHEAFDLYSRNSKAEAFKAMYPSFNAENVSVFDEEDIPLNDADRTVFKDREITNKEKVEFIISQPATFDQIYKTVEILQFEDGTFRCIGSLDSSDLATIEELKKENALWGNIDPTINSLEALEFISKMIKYQKRIDQLNNPFFKPASGPAQNLINNKLSSKNFEYDGDFITKCASLIEAAEKGTIVVEPELIIEKKEFPFVFKSPFSDIEKPSLGNKREQEMQIRMEISIKLGELAVLVQSNHSLVLEYSRLDNLYTEMEDISNIDTLKNLSDQLDQALAKWRKIRPYPAAEKTFSPERINEIKNVQVKFLINKWYTEGNSEELGAYYDRAIKSSNNPKPEELRTEMSTVNIIRQKLNKWKEESDKIKKDTYSDAYYDYAYYNIRDEFLMYLRAPGLRTKENFVKILKNINEMNNNKATIRKINKDLYDWSKEMSNKLSGVKKSLSDEKKKAWNAMKLNYERSLIDECKNLKQIFKNISKNKKAFEAWSKSNPSWNLPKDYKQDDFDLMNATGSGNNCAFVSIGINLAYLIALDKLTLSLKIEKEILNALGVRNQTLKEYFKNIFAKNNTSSLSRTRAVSPITQFQDQIGKALRRMLINLVTDLYKNKIPFNVSLPGGINQDGLYNSLLLDHNLDPDTYENSFLKAYRSRMAYDNTGDVTSDTEIFLLCWYLGVNSEIQGSIHTFKKILFRGKPTVTLLHSGYRHFDALIKKTYVRKISDRLRRPYPISTPPPSVGPTIPQKKKREEDEDEDDDTAEDPLAAAMRTTTTTEPPATTVTPLPIPAKSSLLDRLHIADKQKEEEEKLKKREEKERMQEQKLREQQVEQYLLEKKLDDMDFYTFDEEYRKTDMEEGVYDGMGVDIPIVRPTTQRREPTPPPQFQRHLPVTTVVDLPVQAPNEQRTILEMTVFALMDIEGDNVYDLERLRLIRGWIEQLMNDYTINTTTADMKRVLRTAYKIKKDKKEARKAEITALRKQFIKTLKKEPRFKDPHNKKKLQADYDNMLQCLETGFLGRINKKRQGIRDEFITKIKGSEPNKDRATILNEYKPPQYLRGDALENLAIRRGYAFDSFPDFMADLKLIQGDEDINALLERKKELKAVWDIFSRKVKDRGRTEGFDKLIIQKFKIGNAEIRGTNFIISRRLFRILTVLYNSGLEDYTKSLIDAIINHEIEHKKGIPHDVIMRQSEQKELAFFEANILPVMEDIQDTREETLIRLKQKNIEEYRQEITNLQNNINLLKTNLKQAGQDITTETIIENYKKLAVFFIRDNYAALNKPINKEFIINPNDEEIKEKIQARIKKLEGEGILCNLREDSSITQNTYKETTTFTDLLEMSKYMNYIKDQEDEIIDMIIDKDPAINIKIMKPKGIERLFYEITKASGTLVTELKRLAQDERQARQMILGVIQLTFTKDSQKLYKATDSNIEGFRNSLSSV